MELVINLLKVLLGNFKVVEMISWMFNVVLLFVIFLGYKNENLVIFMKGILVNLLIIDENVVIMVEVNFMKFLVVWLVEGNYFIEILYLIIFWLFDFCV